MIKSPLFYVYVGWSCGLGFMAAQEFWFCLLYTSPSPRDS